MNVPVRKKEGFTIIEVVLVLAIVGLIMLMIFIAWPALQRSQRDGARKNDVNTVAAAVASYRSNNNGTSPTTTAAIQGYISNLNQYDKTDVIYGGTGAGNPTKDKITVRTKAVCQNGVAIGDPSTRKAVVLTTLEGGGSSINFCQDV